jgi:hypothetical protein
MRRIIATAVGAAALLAVPAVTLAAGSHPAKPVPNGNYCINCTAKKAPGSFHVSSDGKSIDHWVYYNNCARVPIPKAPAMPISKDETFHFKGTVKDVTGTKLQFLVKGHFVTSHLIEGVINATGGGRTCKAVSYKAKFTQTGPFQG